MSWQDSIGSLASSLGASASWNHLPSQSTSYQSKVKTYGYDYGSHNVSWSQLGGGRVPPPVGTPKVDEAWKKPPAKMDVAFPTSYAQSRALPPEPKSTQGDFFASASAAIGSTAGNLNLGNVVPWFMERVGVLAQEAADSDVPVLNAAAKGAKFALDPFINGVTAASEVIAPVLEWLPNYVRDGQLHDRTKVYQALVNGGPVDWGANGGGLLGTGLFAGPIGNPIESVLEIQRAGMGLLSGQAARDTARNIVSGPDPSRDPRITGSVSAQANALNEYRDIMLNSVDPEKRLHAQQAFELLREAIDIPQSVKLALEARPNATDEDIQQALDAAPEGRAWSYRAGPEGIGLNLATPLLFYVAEARLGGLAGTGVKALGAEAGLGATGGARLTAGAIEAAGKAVSTATKLQSWAFKAGVGTTILTTSADAIARTVGAQEAVDWFDKVNRTTLFSDNPSVQLVTSFSVNPLHGSKAAAKGVLSLAHGAGDLAVGVVLGKRLMRAYDSTTLATTAIRKLYRLDADASASAFMDDPTHFENRGQAFDHVLQIALEDHVAKLTGGERAHIVAMPALERTEYVAKTYLRQALDTLENDLDGLVARYQLKSADYHKYIGGFDPAVAALNQADYRLTASRTLKLRSNIDAVVGYREALPPEAQALVRERLDDMTDEAGTIATRGLEGINGLIKDFPVLRTKWQGKITDEVRVPRATVERMIDEATADYANLQRDNPIRARTGRDPVLRPHSPSATRGMADALGTNIATVKAIDAADVAEVGLVRRFLTERGVDPAKLDAMTPEEVMAQGDALLSSTVKPWVEMGQKVEIAERAMADLRSTAATLRREGKGAQARKVDGEAAKMAEVIADAGDPLRPFALTESLARGERLPADVRVRAARKVDARVRLGVIESIRTALGDAHMDLPSLESVVVASDGSLAWAPDVAAVPSVGILDAFVRFKTSGPYNTIRKTVGHYNAKHTEEIFTEKAQAIIDLADQGTPGQQWQAMADSPGFLAYLRRQGDAVLGESVGMGDHGLTGTAAADLLESMNLSRGRTSQSLSQVAEAMGLEPQVALQRLSEMKRSYHDALDGRTEAGLKVSRDRIKVSDDAIAQAEADRAVRDAIWDPEYESQTLPTVIAKVAEITANPTDQAMWSALRPLMEGDDAVASGLEAVAARAGLSVDDILADSSHADAVRAELVPDGFTAPDGTIHPASALDEAILRGDDLSVAGLAKKFEENPPKPVRVTGAPLPPVLSDIRPLAEGERGWVHYTTQKSADAIVTTGRFATEGRAPSLGGSDGMPSGTVFIGQEGLPFMEDLLSSHRAVHGDAPLVALHVGLPANLKVLRLPQNFVELDVIRENVGDAFMADYRAAAPGARKVAVAAVAKKHGYDAVEFGGEEMAVFERLSGAAGSKATAATLSKRIPKLRKSYKYESTLRDLGVDIHIAPDDAVLADPRNALGLDVMSILNYGVMGTRPQTLGGVIKVLQMIENRHASAVGIGTDMAAEAQRVAKKILDTSIGQAKKEIVYEGGQAGTIGPGIRGVDHMELAEDITRLISYDDGNPLATLQYGLKKRPKKAVVLEMSTVPGLAEELMTKTYQSFEQRLVSTQVRQVYNYVFGPVSNASLRAKTQLRFTELAAGKGVEVSFTKQLWDVWQKESKLSRSFRKAKTPGGANVMELGDNPLYADVWNIPNDRLNTAAWGTNGGEVRGLINEMLDRGEIDVATAKVYREVDFADLFRTSGSFTKRQLTKVPTLGDDLATLYGQAAHNKAATTLYYVFRFGLDIRFHAQNFFEAQILGLGMAGFRKREVAFGEFGMDSNFLQHLDSNEGALANTGFPLSRSRHATAYQTFLRMKGDPLRKASKGLAAEDPALMQQALEQVRHEPVTADMIAGVKANPDDFIRELDDWHAKMLKNVSLDEDAKVIDQAIADELAASPELAEVLAKLGEVNKGTWDDIRQTIYGNPDRSRAERLLNSYWLYWPLSYQIKSVKWLGKVLFESAGGLKTNASGAWLFDQMASTHQQQLATNPEYQAWFEKHQSLVFVAQMLMPVGFDKVGVSLNPFVRDLFFGGRKEVMGVGPIYTWEGVVKPVVKETYVDLYPVFGDLLMNFTGQRPTKAQQAEVAPKPPEGLTPP